MSRILIIHYTDMKIKICFLSLILFPQCYDWIYIYNYIHVYMIQYLVVYVWVCVRVYL